MRRDSFLIPLSRLTLILLILNLALITAARLPAMPADMLAYTAPHGRDGNLEVMVLDVWRRLVVNVSHDPADDRGQAWSPDGRTLAFQSARDGGDALYRLDVDTGDLARLVGSVDGRRLPAWSPDGMSIAYVKMPDNPNDAYAALAIFDMPSAAEHTVSARYVASAPLRWSADGRGLLMRAFSGTTFEVYAFDVASGTSNRVVTVINGVSEVVTSPDGGSLAVISDDDGQSDLYLVDAAGNASRLTDNTDINTQPAWSPDGARIAFVSARPNAQDIYVVDVATGELTKVTHSDGHYGLPHWTRDGQHLVAAAPAVSAPSSAVDFVLMDWRGTWMERVTLDSRASREYPFAWRPSRAWDAR